MMIVKFAGLFGGFRFGWSSEEAQQFGFGYIEF